MRALFVAALASLLVACGNNTTAPATVQQPTGQTQMLNGQVSAYGFTSHAIEIFRGGTLTVTLMWAGGQDLDLYLTPVTCSGYPPDSCLIYARSTASGGNEERIEWTVAANEQFRIWIDNFSPSAAASYSVVAAVRP